jgi:hypothetical protein
MNRSEAREHLEMADSIVAASTRELSLRYAAPFFIVWGIAAGSVDLIYGLIQRHAAPEWAQWIGAAFLAGAVIFSAVYGSRGRYKRSMTFLEREYLNVLWIAMSVAFAAFAANFGSFGFFTVTGMGAIWTIAASIVAFYIGMHANRRALAGGIVMIVSLFVAGYVPAYGEYVLCAGFYVGYAGFGVSELLTRA